jgi:hypothetical protein
LLLALVEIDYQIGRIDPQCTRDLHEVEHPDIPLATFDATDISPVKSRMISQLLLG